MNQFRLREADCIPAELLNDETASAFFEYCPPRDSYVYFLIKNGAVLYVGQSTSLEGRIKGHLYDKVFDRVLVIPCERDVLDSLERYWIQKLQPILNDKMTNHAKKKQGMSLEQAEKSKAAKQRIASLIRDGAAFDPLSVMSLDVDGRARFILIRAGIESIEQLCKLDECLFLGLRGAGVSSLQQINAALTKIGKQLSKDSRYAHG